MSNYLAMSSDPCSIQSGCSGACGNANYKGDNICDSANNNCGCDWDGGDCCGVTFDETNSKYCKPNCKCLDPNAQQCLGKKTHDF